MLGLPNLSANAFALATHRAEHAMQIDVQLPLDCGSYSRHTNGFEALLVLVNVAGVDADIEIRGDSGALCDKGVAQGDASAVAVGPRLERDALSKLMHMGPHLLAPTGSDLRRHRQVGSTRARDGPRLLRAAWVGCVRR